ncbi:hypothetical protein OPV22_033810 [Ensete ventricosum]|uniref:F-box domain-containing protein n=1 Tax=Ensete ventricosum TaxID=4639 RepID=A0AAV8PND8_ENSVE|nr:hypothetical protein OPV22_033810 [Ensete ventricosum]
MASSDSSLSLQVLRSNLIRVGTRELGLSEALRTVVACVGGNITSIMFHPHLRINDEDVNLIATGCPHLKRLVLPCWDLISEAAMHNAIKGWTRLKSMTMPEFSQLSGYSDPTFIMLDIREYCKSFMLKVLDCYPEDFAAIALTVLHGLKVLSLRCCTTTLEAIMFVVGMRHLEVLNLSHTLVQLDEGSEAIPLANAFEPMDGQRAFKILSKLNLRRLLYCQNYVSCSECRRMMDDHVTHEDES